MTDHTTAAQATKHEAVLTDGDIRAITETFGGGLLGPIQFARAVETALLSKLRAPVADERQPDGKRPDLDWIEGVCVTDTVGRGWCVRIDGTDIFEDVNRYGCKGRRSFQIAADLPSKQEAERAAVEWLDRQRAALASAPVTGNAVCKGSMALGSGCGKCERCRAELASAPVAGHQPYPAVPEPDVIAYGEAEDSYSRAAVEAAMRTAHDRGYSVGWDHGKEHTSAPVAGEAQLPWHFPVQHWTDEEKARLSAEPQVSAEDAVTPPADVAQLVAFIFDRFGRPGDAGELPDSVAAAVRRLEATVQPGAPKDGGQQRAAFDHPVFAFLLGEGQLHGVDFGERAPGAVGKWWWRKDLRAALSATQPEQGERDA